MRIEITGKFENGSFLPTNKEEFEVIKRSLNGKSIRMIIVDKGTPQRASTRRFLMGVLVKGVSEKFGLSSDDAYLYLKHKYLNIPYDQEASTKNLSEEEMQELITKIKNDFMDSQISIQM